MAVTPLTVNAITSAGIADPAGVTGVAAGHSFANDGKVWLRVANSASNANAVITLTPAGTVSGGTFKLAFTLTIGTSPATTYTTAAIAFNASGATTATAVLAATQPNGNAMSADFPSGVVTGGGSALSAGAMTLTFSGTFAAYAVPDPVFLSSLTGTTPSATAAVTTPGAGNGILTLPMTPPASGNAGAVQVVAPAGTSWVGEFNPALVNQSGANGANAFLFYDVPGNYTVTAFRLA